MHANIKEEMERFQQDIDFYELHQEDLLREYPDEWIAIFRQRVVAADPDVRHLLDILQERDYPIDKVVLRKVSTDDDVLILSL